MSEKTGCEDAASVWQRWMQQELQTWTTLLSQPHGLELLRFWMPLMAAWAGVLQQQNGKGADALDQWKRLFDNSMEGWAKVMAQLLESDAFARMSGGLLDQYLTAVGPARKALQTASEEFLRTVNLPSRKQVTTLASQIVAIDARLVAMDERLDEVVGSLARIETLLKQATSPAEHGTRAVRTGKAGARPRREA
jgi:hypothetical protein